MNFNLDWGFTLAVVVVGLVVVFAVLLILVALCSVMGYTFKRIDKNKNDKAGPKKSEPVVTQTAPVVTKAVIAQPEIQSGITGDVVAAISAALACVMGPDVKFAVKSIKRTGSAKGTRGTRNAWNSAGIAENTQPF